MRPVRLSAEHHCAELFASLLRHAGQDMRVDRQRDRRRAVAEQVRHDLDWRPGRQHERRGRVAGVMKPYTGQSQPFTVLIEPFRHRVRVIWPTELASENEAAVVVYGPGGELLLSLACPMGAEQGHQLRNPGRSERRPWSWVPNRSVRRRPRHGLQPRAGHPARSPPRSTSARTAPRGEGPALAIVPIPRRVDHRESQPGMSWLPRPSTPAWSASSNAGGGSPRAGRGRSAQHSPPSAWQI